MNVVASFITSEKGRLSKKDSARLWRMCNDGLRFGMKEIFSLSSALTHCSSGVVKSAIFLAASKTTPTTSHNQNSTPPSSYTFRRESLEKIWTQTSSSELFSSSIFHLPSTTTAVKLNVVTSLQRACRKAT